MHCKQRLKMALRVWSLSRSPPMWKFSAMPAMTLALKWWSSTSKPVSSCSLCFLSAIFVVSSLEFILAQMAHHRWLITRFFYGHHCIRRNPLLLFEWYISVSFLFQLLIQTRILSYMEKLLMEFFCVYMSLLRRWCWVVFIKRHDKNQLIKLDIKAFIYEILVNSGFRRQTLLLRFGFEPCS